MVQLIIRRIGMMILIMLVVALLLFLINEGDPTLIARSVLGPYAQPEQLNAWVIENGYDRSVIVRYSNGSAEYLPAIWVSRSSTSGR